MLNTTMGTYYIYGETDWNGVSADRFETANEAEQACIESMKERKKKGYKVTDKAIIRVEYITIRDEFSVIKTQETKTTVETINKHYVED